jgi:hypothetical protein
VLGYRTLGTTFLTAKAKAVSLPFAVQFAAPEQVGRGLRHGLL